LGCNSPGNAPNPAIIAGQSGAMTRLHSIDGLKFLVALGVVWAHAVLLGSHFNVTNYIIGQGLARTAVPTFAVISGFLFHVTWRRGNTRRWIAGMLAVYAFWCAVYVPVWLPPDPAPGEILSLLITGPIHLWYMAALVLAVLLISAVLRLSKDEASARKRLLWLAVGALTVGTTLQSVNFFTAHDIPLNAYRNGIFLEFPYAVFGFLIAARLQRHGRAGLPGAPVLWAIVAGLALLRLGEAGLSLTFAGLSLAAPPEFPPLAVAFSVAVVLAAVRLDLPKPPLNLAYLSMMIYFLHYLMLLVALSIGVTSQSGMILLAVLVPVAFALVLQAVWQAVWQALRRRASREDLTPERQRFARIRRG
ncbi:MAG: acyltransferase family protein, partial [Pararhodobacter sp.]